MQRKYAFDKVAEEYDRIRPTYPIKVFKDIIEYSNLKQDDNIIEIGCGTGQATEGFVNLGYTNITAVELGKDLCKIAADKFKHYKNINIFHSDFEGWKEKQGQKFDLAISATAFHWIKQNIGYKKTAELLTESGTIGFFWTHHVPGIGEIFTEISEAYQKYAPHLDYNNSNQVEEIIEERIKSINATCLFKDLVVKRYEWVDKYSSEDYIALFNTNSAHQVLDADIKDKLFNNIRETIKKHGDQILKPQFVVLYLARKK
ncbi:methyltransferase domain-containing protein [Clostridium sp. YIM B02515]|uniref:Methyltransferase domain-containing protein n=1 Tax=Clostridium rhizosphaerae TaxID=2803861 RepID=A0ABS1TE92_9CLOT|nr:class I SAM-dependent methyltransferase [Clostridium rhizosphaerae]MBL4937689.1 methyltransferase domain-containing protein [Clostridium rhizosphaerae]